MADVADPPEPANPPLMFPDREAALSSVESALATAQIILGSLSDSPNDAELTETTFGAAETLWFLLDAFEQRDADDKALIDAVTAWIEQRTRRSTSKQAR